MIAVCQQCHGAKQVAGTDLNHHHYDGYQNNQLGPFLTLGVFYLETMCMLPLVECGTMHIINLSKNM
jgi:hypothetical protein